MTLAMTVSGVVVDSTGSSPAPILSDLSIDWGVQVEGAQPPAATMTFSVMVVSSITDAPWLVDGAPVLLTDTTGTATSVIFAGRIRRQQAKPDAFGRLKITVTCADRLTEFDSVYVAADLPPDTAASRLNQLTTIMGTHGFALDFDPTLAPANETRGQTTSISVKLKTLFDRFIAPANRVYYEATRTATPAQRAVLHMVPERPAALPVSANLLTAPDAHWYAAANRAAAGYENLLSIPASNILRDVEWTLDADNITTVVSINWPTREPLEHYTAMEAGPEFSAAPADLDTYGTRRVTIDTDLDFQAQTTNPAQWPATVARLKAAWLDTNPEWLPAAVTIRDATELVTSQMGAVLDITRRNNLWMEITSVSPNQPVAGPSIINAAVIGGKLKHTRKGWQVTLSLSKTILPLPVAAADQWTFAGVAASSNPDIALATCATVGDIVTVSDFDYIRKGA